MTTLQSYCTDEYTLADMAIGTKRMLFALLHGAIEVEPNAPAPINVRLTGSTSDGKGQPENTDAPSDNKPVDSDTDESAEQLWNAPSPTLVTLLGSVTSSRPAQPANALAATLCTSVLICTAPEQHEADGQLWFTQPVGEMAKAQY